MPALPSFLSLKLHYPRQDHRELKNTIGGKVDADWITNTCAIRLSAAFNGCGAAHEIPGPSNVYGLHVVSGASGRWYAYRVTEVVNYLRLRYGEPTVVDARSPEGMGARLAGKSGVIQFDVSGWSDATGHLDLWDGDSCSLKCYFLAGPTPVTRAVRLWTC